MEKDKPNYEEHWQVVQRSETIKSETPKELFANGMAYFKWCADNPVVEEVTIRTGKRAGQTDTFKRIRPYTLKALCLHCNITEEYITDVRRSKLQNSEWYIVITKLLYIIYVQNQELAINGVFNGVFVSRMLGMEKEETPVHAIKVEVVEGLPALSESENEEMEKLELNNDLNSD